MECGSTSLVSDRSMQVLREAKDTRKPDEVREPNAIKPKHGEGSVHLKENYVPYDLLFYCNIIYFNSTSSSLSLSSGFMTQNLK